MSQATIHIDGKDYALRFDNYAAAQLDAEARGELPQGVHLFEWNFVTQFIIYVGLKYAKANEFNKYWSFEDALELIEKASETELQNAFLAAGNCLDFFIKGQRWPEALKKEFRENLKNLLTPTKPQELSAVVLDGQSPTTGTPPQP